ncbi:ATPase [Aureibaculum algae]|uniref:ATPase n=1 Tax=Aureibaculum algae TaxID=2584122 RepID=A0A5B7TYM3_9FLAO|nr:ATPase [Aureibaculum algae]QCX40276.1 ATPase [Aureibaculum algae]
MISQKPHIIVEDSVQYQLGELKENQIHYDFDKLLIYLDVKGKLLFGKKFKIFEEDREIVFKLCNYFIQEEVNCKKLGIDINKGILLSGPVGCGKTSLMKLLPSIVPHHRIYQITPTRNVAFAFNHTGYKTIEHFGNQKFYCFDDLGVEPTGRFFGKDCNVMGEILLSRYDLFLKHKIKTHATTNLNAKELEDRYGNRVRSRMRQLFNLVAFEKSSEDKRI